MKEVILKLIADKHDDTYILTYLIASFADLYTTKEMNLEIVNMRNA